MKIAGISAVAVAGVMTVVALYLVVARGGLIAWSVLVIGIALLVKVWIRPSLVDPGAAITVAVVAILAWFGTHQYVISTWESGEVVELTIEASDGPRTVRLWVLDIEEDPLVYYDAEPELAAPLLAGKPVQFVRAGEASTRIPQATPIDVLREDEGNRILSAMQAKYGDRNNAAVIYFAMLGRARDRVALVASLVEE